MNNDMKSVGGRGGWAGIVAGALMVAAGPALADGPFSGTYVGVDGGLGMTTGRVHLTSGTYNYKSSKEETGLLGGASVGYGDHLTSSIYLGVEADAHYANAKYTASSGSLSGDITEKFNYGVYGRLGYTMNTTMLFAKGGWASAQFDATATDGIARASSTQWFSGAKFGGGIETYVAAGLFLKAEYAHTFYGARAWSSGGVTAKFDGDEDAITTGVGYRF